MSNPLAGCINSEYSPSSGDVGNSAEVLPMDPRSNHDLLVSMSPSEKAAHANEYNDIYNNILDEMKRSQGGR